MDFGFVLLEMVAMPKLGIAEDGDLEFLNADIGVPENFGGVQPVMHAGMRKRLAESKFYARILPADARHRIGNDFGVATSHDSLLFREAKSAKRLVVQGWIFNGNSVMGEISKRKVVILIDFVNRAKKLISLIRKQIRIGHAILFDI